MDQEFLDLFNRELQVLREQAIEFSEEYPSIAERLGGLVGDRQDPMITGLLEGAAFLAARVQLKLKHEFHEFTSNLLEQLVPNYLAPTPSALLAKVVPPYPDPALREGIPVARAAYLDATYRERDRRISCRYRLTSPVTLWPFDITAAEYLPAPGPLQALGVPVGPTVAAGLRISLVHRTAARSEDEMPAAEAAKQPDVWFAGCRTQSLPIYVLGGSEADAVALYEQLFAHCVELNFRYLNQFGDPVIVPAPPECLQPVGFDEDDALLSNDKRIFRGFDFLREYFLFPRKFLAFELTKLAKVMPRLPANAVEVIFGFDEVNPRLAAVVKAQMLSLYTAPAINLFEKTTDRISIKPNQHEYHVVPDRSHYLDFEPHRLLEVYAHLSGGSEKVPVYPLYSSPPEGAGGKAHLYYTLRRLPRRRGQQERRYGSASDYTGTDMFIALSEPASGQMEGNVAELSVRALCSNRHLPEQLPVGEGGADFRLIDNVKLDVMCVAGPTRPKGPVVGQIRSRRETIHAGAVAWRLINLLSLSHLGLVERGGGRGGKSLIEILSHFADLSDSAMEARIHGVRSLDSRPVVRRIRQKSGVGVARGIEITVTLQERAFEGSGVFLLGAILDQFFVEYVALNHFTQLVLRTVERGEVMRWPPRAGARSTL